MIKLDGSKPQGIVIGVDRDDLLAVDGAYTLPFCDITKESTLAKISQILNGQRINSVISDMVCYTIFLFQLVKWHWSDCLFKIGSEFNRARIV